MQKRNNYNIFYIINTTACLRVFSQADKKMRRLTKLEHLIMHFSILLEEKNAEILYSGKANLCLGHKFDKDYIRSFIIHLPYPLHKHQ